MVETIKVFKKKTYNNTYSQIPYYVWKQIEEKLKNKYKFEYYYYENNVIRNDNWKEILVNEMLDKNYDVLIGEYDIFQNKKIYEKVNFTAPYYFHNKLILYKNQYTDSIYKYILKIWLMGVIILITVSLLINFFVMIAYKINIAKEIIYSIFGDQKHLFINKNIDHVIKIFVIIVGFFSFTMMHAITTSNYINFTPKHNLIAFTLNKQKIIVNKYQTDSINKIIREKGIPIKTNKIGNEIIKYYVKNQHIYDGFICEPYDTTEYYIESTSNTIKFKNIDSIFNISDFNLGFYPSSFPISKKKKDLLNDINKILIILDDEWVKNAKYTKKTCIDLGKQYNNNLLNKGYIIDFPCSI